MNREKHLNHNEYNEHSEHNEKLRRLVSSPHPTAESHAPGKNLASLRDLCELRG
jgi:hypothetical protein